MIDVEEFVWRTTIPLTSDSSVLTHFEPIQSFHALATQQNVLSRRFLPVFLTSSGGSLGYLFEGPIVGLCQTSTGASPVLTHDSGAVTLGLATLDPINAVAMPPDTDYAYYYNADNTIKTWSFVIPQRGYWTVSGLSGDSIFFV